jgi:uncharacterized membrane protein
MYVSSRQIVTFARGTLWIASFYLLGVLTKLYYQADVGFKDSIHVLGFGIFFFTLFVMGIMHQTRHEENLHEQTKHIIRAAILLTVNYGFCCLLAFAFFDRWFFPYF